MATPAARRRRATTRRTIRQHGNDGRLILAGVAVVLLVMVAHWANQHRAIAGLTAAVVLVVGGWWTARIVHGRIRAHQARWIAPTDLHAYLTATPDQFEQQTAALCRRDGCRDARVVGGAGDLAADVLATTPDGRRILIQCKRYALHNMVGSDHVQRVNGTYRDIHRCEQAIIVTTSGYTRDAAALARRVNIRLVDGEGLAAWARGGLPPWR